jgi:hypothetical protein
MNLAVLWLCLALQPPAAQGPRVLAQFQFDGKTQSLTADDVALEMAFHQRRESKGREAAEHLANTTIVTMEATAKKLMPADAETRAFWEEQKAAMRRAGQKPELMPVVRNSSEEEMLHSLALHLANEKLVRAELRMKRDEAVSPDMLKLWLAEARKRHKVVTDPDQLPAGTAARVDDQELSMLELGRLLLRTSEDEEQLKFVQQVVVLKTVDQLARQHDVQVSEAELRAELQVRAADAASDPSYKGIPFEQLLKSQGLTPDLLMRSPVFRAQILQRKLALKLHPAAELEARLHEDRKAVLAEFGARRRLGGIFVRALDKPNELVPRDFPKAMAHLAQLRKQLGEGRDFELMAKIETEDPTSKPRGGDLGFHHAREERRKDALPEAVLAAGFALAANEVSQPIQVPEGCWLVKVLAIEPEPSDAELVQRMRDQIVRGMTLQIVKDAKIQFAQ